jgi:protein-L-isoaspartate O-methyltransferase
MARAFSYQAQARAFPDGCRRGVGARPQVWVDLHRTNASKPLYANPPDWLQMRVWQERLRPGDLFLDIGANVDRYSALAASLGATVFAVEAASDTAELLRENFAPQRFCTGERRSGSLGFRSR